jgi:hypothetical protein
MPTTEEANARAIRLTDATNEARALREWKEAGEQGDRPDTTNLDALEAEKMSPTTTKPTTRGPGRPKQQVRFAVDGQIQSHKTRAYTLGYLAFDHTAALAKAGAKRLTTAEFRSLLASKGVTDPTGSAWGPLELGGKTFQAVLDGQVPAKPKGGTVTPITAAKKSTAKKAAAPKKATAKKSTPAKKAPAKKAASKKPAARRSGIRTAGKVAAPPSGKIVPRPEAR